MRKTGFYIFWKTGILGPEGCDGTVKGPEKVKRREKLPDATGR